MLPESLQEGPGFPKEDLRVYKAVVFDMDGTVLNTLDDLADSLNYALEKTGHFHDWKTEDVRLFFGSGAYVAAKRALSLERGMDKDLLVTIGTPEERLPEGVREEDAQAILKVFAPWYVDHCLIKTGPYPGIPEVLSSLRERGIATAVVSNKLDGAVQELVRDLFPGMFDFCLGESETIKRKPAPDMTLRCMEVLGAGPETAVYVGDSEVDLQTAANTGMPCIAVDWGFRTRQFLESRGAKVIVSDAEGLLSAILDPGKDL